MSSLGLKPYLYPGWVRESKNVMGAQSMCRAHAASVRARAHRTVVVQTLQMMVTLLQSTSYPPFTPVPLSPARPAPHACSCPWGTLATRSPASSERERRKGRGRGGVRKGRKESRVNRGEGGAIRKDDARAHTLSQTRIPVLSNREGERDNGCKP